MKVLLCVCGQWRSAGWRRPPAGAPSPCRQGCVANSIPPIPSCHADPGGLAHAAGSNGWGRPRVECGRECQIQYVDMTRNLAHARLEMRGALGHFHSRPPPDPCTVLVLYVYPICLCLHVGTRSAGRTRRGRPAASSTHANAHGCTVASQRQERPPLRCNHTPCTQAPVGWCQPRAETHEGRCCGGCAETKRMLIVRAWVVRWTDKERGSGGEGGRRRLMMATFDSPAAEGVPPAGTSGVAAPVAGLAKRRGRRRGTEERRPRGGGTAVAESGSREGEGREGGGGAG